MVREMLPQSGARGWYREPTKLLRTSSFIGSRLTNRNRFPGDFNLSCTCFSPWRTLNLQGHVRLSWKSKLKFLVLQVATRGNFFRVLWEYSRCPAMGVLMVLKYFQSQEPVATAIQEFDAQRLRQKFLDVLWPPRTPPKTS